MKRGFVLSVLLMAVLFLAGCGETNARPFVPLSPPSGASYILSVQQVTVGEAAQLMSITSPHIGITYRENSGANVGVSANVGSSATEIVEVGGLQGTMTQFTWGDWENATLTLN